MGEGTIIIINFKFLTMLLIGHVRYINILTRLRDFQVKLLYLVLFSLYPSLFWELTRKPRSHVRILIYRTWPIQNVKKECQNPAYNQ